MAKIKAGIIHGFSGSIGNVTGYRRDGNSIITTKPKQKNTTLNTDMMLRNNFKNVFYTFYRPLATLEKNRRFVNPNCPVTLATRMKDIQQNWASFENDRYINFCLLSYKQMCSNVKYTVEMRPSDKLITFRWKNVQQNGTQPTTTHAYWILMNLSKNLCFYGGAVRPILSGSFSAFQAGWDFGDKYLLSMMWPNANSNNPSVMIGGWSYLGQF